MDGLQLQNLINAIHDRVDEINREEEQTAEDFFDIVAENFREDTLVDDEKGSGYVELEKPQFLIDVFRDSVHKTNVEIKEGAKPEEFVELALLNFVIDASQAGFEADEIKEFVGKLL